MAAPVAPPAAAPGIASSRRRIPGLDGLRGIAILMVLAHRFTLVGGGAATLLHAGWMGVDLFFVLSGFLITGILWDARGSSGYFRRFYARRTRRIFPLYYLVLAAAFFVVPHLPLHAAQAAKAAGVEGREWWYWLYLGNFEMAHAGRIPHAALGVSWTLAIEGQFYLVWPVVVLLLNRRTLMRLCAALVLLAPAIRIAHALGGSDYLPMYVLTWCRMDALAAGAWVALAARGPGGLAALRPAARWAVMVGFAAVVGIAIKEGGTSARLDGIHTVGFSALALMGAGLLVVAGTGTNGVLGGRTLGTFAKYSYAMYLFHTPVRILVTRYGFTPDTWLEQLEFYGVATAATLAAAWVSWHLIEKRFLGGVGSIRIDSSPKQDTLADPDASNRLIESGSNLPGREPPPTL